ncbi:hypothetical protein D3C86_1748020 [compost metagenome]
MTTTGTVQIVFQRYRRAHGTRHRFYHRLRQQSPAKVGVQHGAAEVEYRGQCRTLPLLQPRAERLCPVTAPVG